MLAEQWYYRLDGKSHGPFTVAQFEKLIRGRAIAPDTDVSKDAQTWQSLRVAMTGVASEKPVDPKDWANAPTLIPGQFPCLGKKPDPPA